MLSTAIWLVFFDSVARRRRKRQREEDYDTSANKRLKTQHLLEVLEFRTIMGDWSANFKINMNTVNEDVKSTLHDVDRHGTISLCIFSPPDVMSPLSNDPCYEVDAQDVVRRLEKVKRKLRAERKLRAVPKKNSRISKRANF